MDLMTDHGRWEAVETFGVNCPNCGMLLYRPKTESKLTGEKMAGACINCGYKQDRTTPDHPTPDMARKARLNKCIGFYQKKSVFASDEIFLMNFTAYEAETDAQKTFKNYALNIASRLVKNETIHALVVGAPGVGKTHLANAILQRVQEYSDYRKLCLFIDWNEYTRRLKLGITKPDVQESNDDLMQAIKKADVIVIDDLGSERGSEFDRQAADNVIRICEDKSLIVTTNLKGKDLSARYGSRNISRLSKHGQGNTFGVKGIYDHRMNQ